MKKRRAIGCMLVAAICAVVSLPGKPAEAFAGGTLVNLRSHTSSGAPLSGCSYQLINTDVNQIYAQWESGKESKASVMDGVYRVSSVSGLQYPVKVDLAQLGVSSASEIVSCEATDELGNVSQALLVDDSFQFQAFANRTYTCTANVITDVYAYDAIIPAGYLYFYDTVKNPDTVSQFYTKCDDVIYPIAGENRLLKANTSESNLALFNDIMGNYVRPYAADVYAKFYKANIHQMLEQLGYTKEGWPELFEKLDQLYLITCVNSCTVNNGADPLHKPVASDMPYMSISDVDADGNFRYIGKPGEWRGLTLYFKDSNWSACIYPRCPDVTVAKTYTYVADKTTLSTDGLNLLGLPSGNYVLRQLSAPAGYEVAGDQPIVVAPLTDQTQTYTVETKATYLLGDVNADTKVDADDAVSVLKAYTQSLLTQKMELDEVAFAAADVTANGVVDPDDAVRILKYWTSALVNGTADWNA